ncbi:hypothetical protein I2I05_20400 [Hymenobacter sp. BT683]|uniref:STAS/SEC14 domain-containing protein n=1 Tax=Hymenobacter jeongseonensis TaxID=2791027 RepID=A0ABS0IN34_9BACT|nr:hypothetical protein [Hymenobacter jeongseonensis]MBF9239766.1 hypothetical protein [Hymenobacter jeongseonensis]
MIPPIELASRTLTFRTDLNVMVVRWHSMAEMEVVQADYAQMLAAAKLHGMCDWLLDVRRRQVAAPELSAWVNTSFYPGAVAELAPQRLRMAVLSSPALTAAYVSDPGHKKEVAFALDPARPFDIGLFEDEGQAMQWLRPL